jgi:outer membrane protein TolC
MSLAGGYSQSTANSDRHFSWHQRRGKGTADISFDILLVDFGRIDARERQEREDLVAAQRDLEEAAGAYKDIEQVINNELDLVKILTRLLPIAVIKG